MSEQLTLDEALKKENAEATTDWNATKAKYKPRVKQAAIIAAAIFALSSLTAWYKDYSERKEKEVAAVVTPVVDLPRGSDMVYLELAKGHCSEVIVVPRGQNADYWFLNGTVWMEARASRNSEWTSEVVGSVSQIRFCGDGKVSYQLRPS